MRPAPDAIAWDGRRLDPCAAILEVLGDFGAGRSPATVSARFHNALARVTVRACCGPLPQNTGVQTLVLAGGVFQKPPAPARADLRRRPRGRAPRAAPAAAGRRMNGAISFGQAAIAAATAGGALN